MSDKKSGKNDCMLRTVDQKEVMDFTRSRIQESIVQIQEALGISLDAWANKSGVSKDRLDGALEKTLDLTMAEFTNLLVATELGLKIKIVVPEEVPMPSPNGKMLA